MTRRNEMTVFDDVERKEHVLILNENKDARDEMETVDNLFL